ncbi:MULTISPECIES: YbjQ family protein [Sphingobacterium]|uniref:YbjQ family protein n=1 Tax=Sphingobacterium TaxID=28453 RepID=UPI00257E66A2|nr:MULTISPECIES: heavy metal-binding domain-containing protein [Sphingobacterium]
MIVTTTNSIEGREISRYNDPIAANVVIGTTVFRDIGASYVDFFGGRSTSYEKKMQEMYKRVTATLKQRAQAIRADAIIGLSVDINEPPRKGSESAHQNISGKAIENCGFPSSDVEDCYQCELVLN